MRITIDLPDHLLGEAQTLAAKHRLTLTDMVETGLRKAIEDLGSPSQFHLEDASWGRGGLASGYDWTVVRDLIYESPPTESTSGQ